jgi:hypothetical protein
MIFEPNLLTIKYLDFGRESVDVYMMWWYSSHDVVHDDRTYYE